MIVFIDTNIFYNNWYLNNANFKYLFNYLENTGSKLFLSEIVCSEVDNKFNIELDSLKKHFSDGLKKSKSILNEVPNYNLNKLDVDYSIKKVLSELQNDFKIEYVSYENIDNSKIVERAIKRIKPFQDQDKGYRDTLIWLSLLDYLKTENIDNEISFINNNSKDFLNKEKSNLHPDLIKDIDQFSLKNKFNTYCSIKDFIDKKVDVKQNKYNLNEILEKYLYVNESSIQEQLELYINSQTSSWFQSLLKENVGELSEIVYLAYFNFEIFEGIEDLEVFNWSVINEKDIFVELDFKLNIVDIKLTIPTMVYKGNITYYDFTFDDITVNKDFTVMTKFIQPYLNVSFNFIVDSETIEDLVINTFEAK